ncbi:MAG: hypothetical protein GY906_28495 [bacterium]|nr:hypothetical protein [bacterium]
MRFRPSTIVPSEFEHLDSYDLGNGSDIPSFNLGYVSRFMEQDTADNYKGDLGRCCVCGTHFRYGEIWRHKPSGIKICIGHQCAHKYGLMAITPEYNQRHAAWIRKLERLKERRVIRSEIKKFLISNPDISDHLRGDHRITRDLRAKLIHWGALSPKQIQLAANIKRQEKEQHQADVDLGPSMPAITDRHEMTGVIMTMKWVAGYSTDDIPKMLVRVDGPDGWYKVWGTIPDKLCDDLMKLRDMDAEEAEGLMEIVRRLHPRIKFTATVVESGKDDPTFAFFKRPSKSEVL